MTGRTTKYEGEVTDNLTDEYTKSGFLEDGDVIPTVEGLSEHLGVACSTIHLWATKHTTFSESLQAMVKKQKKILQNMGLLGTFNSTITKLLLSANHGVNETSNVKSENTVKSIVVRDNRDKEAIDDLDSI